MATSNRTAPAKKRAPAKRSRARTADDKLAQLLELRRQLEAARNQLLRNEPDAANVAQRQTWSDQVFESSRAINAVSNAALESLSDEFKAELPNFVAATRKLNDDLAGLQKVVDVLNIVSGALGIFGKIVALLG